MLAVFKRELKSYFRSPIGYVFLAVILFFGGYYFSQVLMNQSTYIQYVFYTLFSVIMILVPIITMRLLSEDKKQKTDQLLFTSPISISGVVLGKYLAAFVLYFIGICSTIIYAIVIASYATPNWNIIMGNFLALALSGAALIAIGLFISSLTENQVIAAIGSIAVMVSIFMFDFIVQNVPIEAISKILSYLSFMSRYNDFMSGIINVSHIIFFISVAVIFNFLTVRVLERKRWS